MKTLCLGVIALPYENAGDDADPTKPRKRGDGSSRGSPTTTVEVATILEAKYGVMQAFYDAHKGDIEGALINSLEGALEDIFAGAPPRDPFGEAGQDIDKAFRTFLMSGEIETMGIEGVPTKAALDRRSGRFKKKKGPERRPSMIDTGLYEASFKSWVDQ